MTSSCTVPCVNKVGFHQHGSPYDLKFSCLHGKNICPLSLSCNSFVLESIALPLRLSTGDQIRFDVSINLGCLYLMYLWTGEHYREKHLRRIPEDPGCAPAAATQRVRQRTSSGSGGTLAVDPFTRNSNSPLKADAACLHIVYAHKVFGSIQFE